jgi:hypothetical protein
MGFAHLRVHKTRGRSLCVRRIASARSRNGRLHADFPATSQVVILGAKIQTHQGQGQQNSRYAVMPDRSCRTAGGQSAQSCGPWPLARAP